MTSPLFVTRDETLLDELLRLAAAAGITPEVASDAGAALRSWTAAPLVLVGADAAEETSLLGPTRRPGVHVVSWGQVPHELFRTALALGAESVTELPRSDTWLTETLTDLGDQAPARSLVVGVVGGSGGAGATTFACALGQVAAHRGHAVVIDCDPLGPGVDRVLGLESHDGFRWDALCQTTGRLSGRALREALPKRGSLGVLSWYAGTAGSLQAFAVREALSAARRGHDVVVVDLPRAAPPVLEEVVARCDLVLLVVQPTVAGVASAARLATQLGRGPQLRLVVRGHGLDPRDVAKATGVPVLAEMSDQRGLAEAIDLGLGPVRSRRGQLGRAAAGVLDRVAVMGRAA
ncbi:septum site-determining protein Ssd [Nocardioides lijunqiniae]|uniref:septum site-determining protein Ssd n=1 Tax=Nocardioides lijunqiniae TaxID=2760832 RepID=UPI0018780B52|nr:septum site-determining protein Ssd [Nocardioides lijunqiniae]